MRIVAPVRLTAMAAAAWLAAGGSVAAEGREGPEAERRSDTFAYEVPRATPMPLRAIIEEGIVFGLSFAGYVLKPLDAPEAHRVSLGDKLRLTRSGLVLDADNIPTNYPGHAVAGMYYYTVARGNRLPVPGALAATAASSALWELSEYREPAALNDLIVTTAGGFAFGEAFTQLGAYLERDGSAWSRLLAFAVQPAKTFHDRLDGLRPARGVPFGAHAVELSVIAGARRSGSSGVFLESGIGASARLLRIPEYGAPGRAVRALLDGEATALGAELAWGNGGLADAAVLAESSLAGLYARDFDASGAGQDLLLVAGTAFDYQRRAEPGSFGGPYDYLVLLRVPGVSLRHRWLAGDAAVETTVDAAITFGAVQPYPLLGRPSDIPGVPGVTAVEGYYHGIGVMAAPALAVRAGAFGAGAAARFDRLRPVTARDVDPPSAPRVPMSDGRDELRAWIRWRMPWRGLEAEASLTRRVRWGRAGDLRSEQEESAALLGVGVAL